MAVYASQYNPDLTLLIKF